MLNTNLGTTGRSRTAGVKGGRKVHAGSAAPSSSSTNIFKEGKERAETILSQEKDWRRRWALWGHLGLSVCCSNGRSVLEWFRTLSSGWVDHRYNHFMASSWRSNWFAVVSTWCEVTGESFSNQQRTLYHGDLCTVVWTPWLCPSPSSCSLVLCVRQRKESCYTHELAATILRCW